MAVVGGAGAASVWAIEVLFLEGESVLEITVLSRGNIVKVISRPLKCGWRMDPAHHGKPWGHPTGGIGEKCTR